MSCNAHNHPPNCNCDFRGGHQAYIAHDNYYNPRDYCHQDSADDYDEHYIYGNRIRESFTTCIKCWYCKKYIFLYKSPYGNWVLFDELGSPWEKHICEEYVRLKETKIEICDVGLTAKFATGWLPVESILIKAGHIYIKAGDHNFTFYSSRREFGVFDKKSPFSISINNNSNTAKICGLRSTLWGTSSKTVTLPINKAHILKAPTSDHEILNQLKLIIERYETTDNNERVSRYNNNFLKLYKSLSNDCNKHQKSRIKNKFIKLFHQKTARLRQK